MNVYECNGTNIFMRWKMKCAIQRSEAELNGTFHLSVNENICSIAGMRKHSLFVLYNLYKDSNAWTNWKEKPLKNNFGSSKTLWTSRVSHSSRDYVDACVTLNACTAPVAFAPRRVWHVVFFISLVLEQMSEDCTGNTEHSNINVWWVQ